MFRKSGIKIVLLCFFRCVFAEDEIIKFHGNRPAGCFQCGQYRCPEDPKKCLLESVPDPCECCSSGLCARLVGEPCWNSSITELSSKARKEGYCAETSVCQLRDDLPPQDEPEAICVCKEKDRVCGTNHETYTTICHLQEEIMRLKSSTTLKLQYTGPCRSRPWIISPREKISTSIGQRIALSCEAKGFPVPDIFWQFQSEDSSTVLKLPVEDHEASITIRDGPEDYMKTSWLLLSHLKKKHFGTYNCIANNTLGEASSVSIVSMA